MNKIEIILNGFKWIIEIIKFIDFKIASPIKESHFAILLCIIFRMQSNWFKTFRDRQPKYCNKQIMDESARAL
jgi:hypothetical protein